MVGKFGTEMLSGITLASFDPYRHTLHFANEKREGKSCRGSNATVGSDYRVRANLSTGAPIGLVLPRR